MAHLWLEQNQNWGLLPLSSEPVALTTDVEQPVRAAAWIGPAPAALFPFAKDGAEWLLLCDPGVLRVNGEPVVLGIKALKDRDEIVLKGGLRLFYSQEYLARIVPFPGSDPATLCPRCKKEIEIGEPYVVCPECGLAYHENRETGWTCWSYSPCHCGCASAADSEYRWYPEEL